MTAIAEFRKILHSQVTRYEQEGLPSHRQLIADADRLRAGRHRLKISGLWEPAPLMITATLDDGIGQGLMIIHSFAKALGIELHPLGLVRPPEEIIDECLKSTPDFLGLTVLHFDSEEDLTDICAHLPYSTRLIAGGPVFRADPEMGARSGVHFIAANVAEFVNYMLEMTA